MTALIFALLAQSPNPSAYFRQSDGGITLRTWADGVTVSGGGSGGTVTQGPGQDGGAWNVSCTNCSGGGGTGGTVVQGVGYDGGVTWGVTLAGVVDSNNSSTTPLGAGATFTGAAVDITNYAQVMGWAYANVASAASGMCVQFSNDGTNWDTYSCRTHPGGVVAVEGIPATGRYFRFVYTNGGVAQSAFRIQAVLKPVAMNGSVLDVDSVPVAGQHSMLSSSVISGKTTGGGGGYVNVKVTPSGALTSEVTQSSFPWLVAGADGGDVVADQGQSLDGGSNWGVWVANSSLVVQQNAGQDGGAWNVSVNNFPATQPVSIATMPTTPVTGTFWQATQPVSIATMPTTPVTGTFWQATQPVSLASTTITGNVAVTHAAGSIAGSNPCSNPTATIVGISGTTSGTASVQLVALSGTTKIYVCSMNITGVSGTTPTFKLQYGTGTACATGTTAIVGPWTTAANTVYNYHGPTFAVTPAGQALCYIQTGTTPVSNYNITYVQQ